MGVHETRKAAQSRLTLRVLKRYTKRFLLVTLVVIIVIVILTLAGITYLTLQQ